MIPTIETIVEDLAERKITKQQAIAWLNQHAEGAANDLRDHFAAMAMQAIASCEDTDFDTYELRAEFAYRQADTMLITRGRKS